ncbi:Hypothetical predicted protein [Mytilus galloprovincialis]|uniref:Uncharacterized protein n=1 Tax=Mytilus galloprovincialis TaxID=29158 RepID=A0A8B6DAP1_MYTGA|nr:Hypothetical predicted protein [Mytilus galloprovincialis]
MPMSQLRTWGIPTTEKPTGKPTFEPELTTSRMVLIEESSRVIIKDHHETSRVARKHTILRDGVWKELKWVSPGVNIPLPSEPWWLARVQNARRMDQQRIGQDRQSSVVTTREPARGWRSLFDLKVEVDAGTADPVLFQAVIIDPIVPKTEPVTEEDMVEEETRVTPTPTRKEEGGHAQRGRDPTGTRSVMPNPNAEGEETGSPPPRHAEGPQLRTAPSRLGPGMVQAGREKEERKGVSFLGNLLAQQSKMLKGFKKSPAPAACPAPKVRQFRGRGDRPGGSLWVLDQLVPEAEAADIVQEKQAVESPSDEEAPPAKKRKEVSNEEKDLLGKFNNR